MALGLIVLVSPILLAAAVAVLLTSGLPILFRQERVGRNGHSFTLIKLRTMAVRTAVPSAKEVAVTARRDPRITWIGRWLRRFKLDELPQLIHVIRGEMALVGPRPEVPRFVDLSDPQWQTVLSVRPGLSDPMTLRLYDEEALLAHAEGDVEAFYRNELLPQKLKAYLAYLDQRTWRSDLRTIAATTLALLGIRKRHPAGTIDEFDSKNRHA